MLLGEVNVVLVVLEALLDSTQELEILLVAPRIAEREPVVLNSAVELEAERHLDLVVFLSPPLQNR